MTTAGERVGAVLSKDDKAIYFIGYGTYAGDEVPDENAVGAGPTLRRFEMANPKIVLDDGTVVWGCECYWGEEEGLKGYLAKMESEGLRIEQVDMAKVRAEARAEV